MDNERNTENIVRNLLRERGYEGDENIVIEEQTSTNPQVNKVLKNASKSGSGVGRPEFIITFKNNPEHIIVIECKANIKYHQSKERDRYSEYAVDGVLLYASYLKDVFNVMAIAVSGETDREVRISHFLWLKQKYTYKDVSDKNFIEPKSMFSIVEKQSKPLREDELILKAIEYNVLLHKYSIPEVDRCTIISSILVALQEKAFSGSYNSYHTDDDDEVYNPNAALVDALLNACRQVLLRNKISSDKQEIIIREYEKLKSNHTLANRTILIERKKEEKNTVLRDLINDIMINIMPYINNNTYDVLGKFYTQFIRYAGSDSKTGLVLTPQHITDLFCSLAEINENDVVYDPCCGTGGFLVAAMNMMIKESGNDSVKHRHIKSRQLIGVEKRPDMFSHACSNMMMRGDGKSHIYYGDCFSKKIKDNISLEKPTKIFLNPPYDIGPAGQLEFIDNAMESITTNGICIAICQMSTCTDTKHKTVEVKRKLLERHTLEAVLSMPDDLFYPVGVITSILIFKGNSPHPDDKKSFFGYFKEDGFVKVKNKGRLDLTGVWLEIKNKWISAYKNKEHIPGLSVTKKVTAEDEWCAEAYIEADYSMQHQGMFADVVKKYVAFHLISGSTVPE